MQFTHHYASPLGDIMIASDGTAITGLWFADQKYFAAKLDPEHEEKDLAVFKACDKWLDTYFTGKDPGDKPPLSLQGTPFQKQVWDILLTIPFGSTTTYGEIARRLEQKTGKHQSPHAVGGAVAHNPISLIVPCHRVLGSDGSLTGYAGGLDKKVWLLKNEKSYSH